MTTETLVNISAASKNTGGAALLRDLFPGDASGNLADAGEKTIIETTPRPRRRPHGRRRMHRSTATQTARQILDWQPPVTGVTQPRDDHRSLLHCGDKPLSSEPSGNNAPHSANQVDSAKAASDVADPFNVKQRVLIVDDEPLARERLRRFLLKEPSVEIVGECCDGLEALVAIKGERPDIVFLDMQMSGCDGLGVVARLAPDERPAIIFVTAHLRYEVESAGVGSIDYILKPFGQERIQQALKKAQEYLRTKREDEPRE